MPTKIQNPDAALRLAQAYNIKGRLPLVLDEVVVPVHILGELDPSNPPVPESPPGSNRYTSFFSIPASGAGRDPVCVIQFGEPGEEMKQFLVEAWFPNNMGAQAFVWGLGINSGPQALLAGPQRLIALNRSPNGPVFGVDNVRMWGAAYPTGTVPGPQIERWTNREAVSSPTWMNWPPPNVVTGTVRSVPYWATAAPAAVLVGGNAEVWIQRFNSPNSNLELNVRVSVSA